MASLALFTAEASELSSFLLESSFITAMSSTRASIKFLCSAKALGVTSLGAFDRFIAFISSIDDAIDFRSTFRKASKCSKTLFTSKLLVLVSFALALRSAFRFWPIISIRFFCSSSALDIESLFSLLSFSSAFNSFIPKTIAFKSVPFNSSKSFFISRRFASCFFSNSAMASLELFTEEASEPSSSLLESSFIIAISSPSAPMKVLCSASFFEISSSDACTEAFIVLISSSKLVTLWFPSLSVSKVALSFANSTLCSASLLEISLSDAALEASIDLISSSKVVMLWFPSWSASKLAVKFSNSNFWLCNNSTMASLDSFIDASISSLKVESSLWSFDTFSDTASDSLNSSIEAWTLFQFSPFNASICSKRFSVSFLFSSSVFVKVSLVTLCSFANSFNSSTLFLIASKSPFFQFSKLCNNSLLCSTVSALNSVCIVSKNFFWSSRICAIRLVLLRISPPDFKMVLVDVLIVVVADFNSERTAFAVMPLFMRLSKAFTIGSCCCAWPTVTVSEMISNSAFWSCNESDMDPLTAFRSFSNDFSSSIAAMTLDKSKSLIEWSAWNFCCMASSICFWASKDSIIALLILLCCSSFALSSSMRCVLTASNFSEISLSLCSCSEISSLSSKLDWSAWSISFCCSIDSCSFLMESEAFFMSECISSIFSVSVSVFVSSEWSKSSSMWAIISNFDTNCSRSGICTKEGLDERSDISFRSTSFIVIKLLRLVIWFFITPPCAEADLFKLVCFCKLSAGCKSGDLLTLCKSTSRIICCCSSSISRTCFLSCSITSKSSFCWSAESFRISWHRLSAFWASCSEIFKRWFRSKTSFFKSLTTFWNLERSCLSDARSFESDLLMSNCLFRVLESESTSKVRFTRTCFWLSDSWRIRVVLWLYSESSSFKKITSVSKSALVSRITWFCDSSIWIFPS